MGDFAEDKISQRVGALHRRMDDEGVISAFMWRFGDCHKLGVESDKLLHHIIHPLQADRIQSMVIILLKERR